MIWEIKKLMNIELRVFIEKGILFFLCMCNRLLWIVKFFFLYDIYFSIWINYMYYVFVELEEIDDK